MRIAIDGGALSTNSHTHYGNFTVTHELLTALFQIDKENLYDIYTIDDFKMTAPSNFNFIRLAPTYGWMKLRVSVEQALTQPDVFLALNQALPFYTSGKIISISHGLSFMEYPHFYPDSAARMTEEIKNIYAKSDTIVVSSEKVKNDFKKYLGSTKKINTLLFGVPSFFKEKSLRYKRKKIILYVGMGHPIKQLHTLIESFGELINDRLYNSYILVLVGVTKEYINSLNTLPQVMKKIITIPHATQNELMKFYNEASCVVSTSLYESFNLPVLEALSQNTPVVTLGSAVIPEMKEFITVSKDKSDLTKKIKKTLSTNSHTNLRKLHKNFSWTTFAVELIKLYEK